MATCEAVNGQCCCPVLTELLTHEAKAAAAVTHCSRGHAGLVGVAEARREDAVPHDGKVGEVVLRVCATQLAPAALCKGLLNLQG